MAAEDDSDVPETGGVFTFGKSKFADNLPSKFWVKNDKVLHVACGDEHTAIVNETGRVFTFGANDWGQLGLDHTKPAYKPTCVKKLKQEKSYLVACGRVHTIVATESGKLYSFGANSEGQLGIEDCSSSNDPREITGISTHKYKQLSAGADHSAALTEDGEVYVWGGGSEGQLGLGDETECPQPQLLDIEGKVTCLSCGYYHTAFVTESGELYTFGESDGGKLGLGDADIKAFVPTKVELPEKAKQVSCGNTHTVVLLESGKAYSFGDGNNGQLGHGNRTLETPSPKQIFCKPKIKQVSCGDSHTALISEKDQLYTFGDGRHGKLGQGQESYCNIYAPTLIERFKNFHVTQVSCGGCHMLTVGHKRLQTEIEESSEEEAEESPEIVNKNLLNASLKADGSLDLNNSFTAREKRRQNTLSKSPSIIKRQLPELNNNKPPPLSATMPPNETPLAKERIHGVHSENKVLHNTVDDKSKHKKDEDSEEESETDEEEEADSNVNKHIEEVKTNRVQSVPRPMPRPSTQKPLEDVQKKEDKKEKEDESDEETEEEEDKPSHIEQSESKLSKPTESEEDEDDSEEEESKSKPTPTKRSLPKMGEDKHVDSEEEEVKASTSSTLRTLPTVPVPQPRKGKHEKDEEDEETDEEKDDKKKKDKKKGKKSSKTKIFGTTTGLSDEDEGDDEEEEDEDEETKKKEMSEEEEDDGKKKKDKKKGKDKEDKKGKKDKKKDKKDKDKKKKKGKKDEDEEEDEDKEEEEGVKSEKEEKNNVLNVKNVRKKTKKTKKTRTRRKIKKIKRKTRKKIRMKMKMKKMMRKKMMMRTKARKKIRRKKRTKKIKRRIKTRKVTKKMKRKMERKVKKRERRKKTKKRNQRPQIRKSHFHVRYYDTRRECLANEEPLPLSRD